MNHLQSIQKTFRVFLILVSVIFRYGAELERKANTQELTES